MEMFEPGTLKERIGSLQKSVKLYELEQVEEYALEKLKEVGLNHTYDVIANEPPDFWTMGYTEYASSFIFQPLNLEAREAMIADALCDTGDTVDYASMLRNNIKEKTANKYQDRDSYTDVVKPRKNIVVLPGSNKIKQRVCLNKLNYIKTKHGDDVLFKPHPITVHAVIGELKDMFGEENVLPRDSDLYEYIQEADKVYTTHMSESAIYGLALNKVIEPIDTFNEVHMASFYNINKAIFSNQDLGDEVINKICSSYKSGFINPNLEPNWKEKVDKYIEYIMQFKDKRKNWYTIKKDINGEKEIQGN